MIFDFLKKLFFGGPHTFEDQVKIGLDKQNPSLHIINSTRPILNRITQKLDQNKAERVFCIGELYSDLIVARLLAYEHGLFTNLIYLLLNVYFH